MSFRFLLIVLFGFLLSFSQAFGNPLCSEVFGIKVIRPNTVSMVPNPPKAGLEPSKKAIAELRQKGRSWFDLSRTLTAISNSTASYQGRFHSSFFGRELDPQVAAAVSHWPNWSQAKYVAFGNLYRDLNPNHENYRLNEAKNEDIVDLKDDLTQLPLQVQRQSARVFPKEEPIIVSIGETLELLHNGSRIADADVLARVADQIPKEIPKGLIGVFRGTALTQKADTSTVPGQIPFVAFRPQEYLTYRALTSAEIKNMVLVPPEGLNYSPLPPGSVIIQKPAQIPEGASIEYGVRLSYTSLRYRNRSVVPFIGYVIAKDGKIIEVGVGSKEMIGELKSQTGVGRKISELEKSEIREFTTSLFEAVGKTEASFRAMTGFREWPAELVKQSGVVHLDPAAFSVKEWALEYGKSRGWEEKKVMDLLLLSGWAEYGFNRYGRPSYRVLEEKGDLIPFYENDSRRGISYFRMRRSQPMPGVSKYREFPEFYSVSNSPREDQVFYTPRIRSSDQNAVNSKGSLSQRLGLKFRSLFSKKQLVVTEGEFKSLVAEHFGPYPVVALSGIHSYGPDLMQNLVREVSAQKIDEVVVIFDGDPVGKGLARADGLSDSKRQAYAFGRELEESILAAQTKGELKTKVQVRVGLLPKSTKPGAKDAIDDLILENPEAGVKTYIETVESAMTLSEYAKKVRLDEALVELYLIQKNLEKSLMEVRAAKTAGVQFNESQARQIQATETAFQRADEALKTHLVTFYKTESLTTSEKTISRIPPSGRRDQFQPKGHLTVLRQGQVQDITQFFRHEVIVVPTRLKDNVRENSSTAECRTAACFEMPYKVSEIANLFRRNPSKNESLEQDFIKGLELAAEQDFKLSRPEDLRLAVLGGFLANRIYPGEIIELGLKLSSSNEVNQTPMLAVRRKSSGNAIGVFFSQQQGADSIVQELWSVLRPGMSLVK